MSISSEAELGKALKNGAETIEIEGDLKNRVLRIKATGKIAWLVAVAAIGIAVAVLFASGGTGAPVSGVVGVGAVSVLGLPAAISAVSIAFAAGGVGALNSLRKYKVVKQTEKSVILKRG